MPELIKNNLRTKLFKEERGEVVTFVDKYTKQMQSLINKYQELKKTKVVYAAALELLEYAEKQASDGHENGKHELELL